MNDILTVLLFAWGSLMLKRWAVVGGSVLLFLGASTLQAGEPVAISAILASPETYHFREVTLQGTARQVKPIGMFVGKCGIVYDAYTLVVEDGTGGIEVDVGGSCRGPGIVTVVDDGDRVLVEAVINKYIGGAGPPTVRASAKDIKRVAK